VRLAATAIAAALALSGCSSQKPDTAAEDAPVTMDKLYAIAKNGNNAEFDMAWATMNGQDPNIRDPKTGQALVHYAAENRTSPLMMHAVLMTGADPNRKDGAGLTPLRHALMANNQVAVRNLVIRNPERMSVQDRARTIMVRTDIAGPDGRTDLELCQDTSRAPGNTRSCQVMIEVLNGATRSTPAQLGRVLQDLDQARNQSDMQ